MAQSMDKMVGRLNDLIALDIDAINAYEAAIKRINVQFIADRLREFQQDHERHVRDLSAAVSQLGGQPRRRPDAKGFILKGFTAATSAMGNEAALRAMQGNEKLTNHSYEKAMREQWPPDVVKLISRNYADEQRHLAFIEDCIRDRSWESPQATQP